MVNDDTSLVADYACNGQLNLMRTAALSPMLRGIAVSAFARVHPLSKGHGGFHNGLFLRARCTLNVFLQDASACYERA